MFSPEAEAAYNARMTVTAEVFDAVMADYRRRSDDAIVGLPGHTNIAFDPGSDERLDIWGIQPGELRPAVVAIHGGYWRTLSRHDTAFMASALAEANVATVTLDYALAPAASLEEIIRQVRASVAWLHRHGRDHGIDPARLVVLGSSAGGHLAAATIVGGWQREWGLPDDAIHGAMLISGLFDLRPLVGTTMNEWLFLDEKRAVTVSPAFEPIAATPVVMAVGEHEASGFFEQTRDFHARWKEHAPSLLRVIPGRHHFDVFLDLSDPDSVLFADLLALLAPKRQPS